MNKTLVIALAGILLFATVAVSSATTLDVGVKGGYATLTGDKNDAFDGALSGGLYVQHDYSPTFAIQGSWLWHKHDATEEANAVSSTVDIGTATATDFFEPVTITNNAPATFPLGDTIVTSNISTVFPKGFPVGIVTKLIEEPDKTHMSAQISTFTKPASLDQVIVLFCKKDTSYEQELDVDRSEW